MPSDAAEAERTASLSDVAVRRAPYAVADKDGDITAMLAGMPPAPEILDPNNLFTRMPDAGNLRDVTPNVGSPPGDIMAYWNDLRGTRAMPFRDQLRASDVASRWPNLVLFRCSDGAARMHPDAAFATAVRANRAGDAAVLPRGAEITAMLSQWMLRVARVVAENGAPVQDRSHIDSADGRLEYAMITLPFGEDHGDEPAYVLCHIEPA